MVDKKTVEYVARLARLKLDDTHVDYLSSQLSNILNYIDKLKELDVSSIEPLRALHVECNVLREDEVTVSSARDSILAQAPLREGEFIRIPKVIE